MNLSRERACDGKKPHRTRAAARAAARELRQRGAHRIAAYRCMHCAAWHIGHQPYPEETTTP